MMCGHVSLSLKRKKYHPLLPLWPLKEQIFSFKGSPDIDGLHFCLTDGSPIKKNPLESKRLKKTKIKKWWWFGHIKKKRRSDI